LRHQHRIALRPPAGWLAAGAAVAVLVAASCASTPDGAISTGSSSVSAPSALVGTTWRLTSIDGQPALAGVRVTAVFASDADRVAGSAGCNQYFGQAAVKGERIEVGGLGSTKMFCTTDGVMPQEAAYLSALGRAAAYRVAGRQLQLGPAAGVVTLVFEAE
jgi:heat shock protein HslJ